MIDVKKTKKCMYRIHRNILKKFEFILYMLESNMGTVANTILTVWCVKGTVSREFRWVNPKENPAPFLLLGTKSPYPICLLFYFVFILCHIAARKMQFAPEL